MLSASHPRVMYLAVGARATLHYFRRVFRGAALPCSLSILVDA